MTRPRRWVSIGCWCLPNKLDLIDCRGLRCPLPVLKLEKRFGTLPPGAGLVVLATDPMAKVDIPLFCLQNGGTCAISEADGVLRFEITRA